MITQLERDNINIESRKTSNFYRVSDGRLLAQEPVRRKRPWMLGSKTRLTLRLGRRKLLLRAGLVIMEKEVFVIIL